MTDLTFKSTKHVYHTNYKCHLQSLSGQLPHDMRTHTTPHFHVITDPQKSLSFFILYKHAYLA